MRVQATAPGFYLGQYRDIGDVFDLANPSDLVSSTVSQVPPGNPDYPFWGWMMTVPGATAIFSWASQGLSSPVLAPERTVY